MHNRKEETLTKLAKKHIRSLETLERQYSDRDDFHEVSVWSLKELLEEAYEAGMAAVVNEEDDREPKVHIKKVSSDEQNVSERSVYYRVYRGTVFLKTFLDINDAADFRDSLLK